MQRRTVLFLLSAGTLAAVAGLWWSAAEPPAPPAPGGRAEVPVPGPRGATAPPDAPPTDAPQVHVEVTVRERFVPPPPARVQAVRAHDGVELPTTVLAGVGGGFDGELPAAGPALVTIAADGARLVRQVAVAAGGVARPTVGGRLVVRGTVRGDDGRPLAAARVWLGELDGSGRREAATDADGAFELDVPAGAGVPLVVAAAGFATTWRLLDVAAPPPVADVVLEPGGTLELNLAALAVALTEVRVFVVPLAEVSTALAQWPFALQALDDGVSLDGSGRARIDGLPRRGTLGVLVRHPRAPLEAPQPVALKGEHTRVTVPLVVAERMWRGRVVDGEGQALAGVCVWVRPPGRRLLGDGAPRLLPPHLDLAGAVAATTGPDGTFVVGALDGDVVLSLRHAGHAGRDLAAAALAAAADLVLPAWGAGEPALRLAPPSTGVPWVASSNLGGGVRVAVAADAEVTLALPHAGLFDLVLSTSVAGELRGRTRLEAVAIVGPQSLRAPPCN